jgi:hypothetical protein
MKKQGIHTATPLDGTFMPYNLMPIYRNHVSVLKFHITPGHGNFHILRIQRKEALISTCG